MPKLHHDFLGPFVECNGAINRPMENKRVPSSLLKSVRPVAGTPTVHLKLENGSEQLWHDCGGAPAYKQARDTLPKDEFENFVAMAASFSVMSSGKGARALYPDVARHHPAGHIDHQSAQVREHLAESRRLQQAYCASTALEAMPGLIDLAAANTMAKLPKIRRAIL